MSEPARCWFCDRPVGIDYLIAGYDTWDEQRLACLDCDRAIHALRDKGWLAEARNEGSGLDAAWAAAEAALGEWWRIRSLVEIGDKWEAVATDGRRLAAERGPTPAHALQALAARLRGSESGEVES